MKNIIPLLVLTIAVSAGNIAEWKTAEQWFAMGHHSKFSVHQQQQAILAAIMLKMEEVAPLLGLECDVNQAYYWQYREKDHKGQFWTNAWESNDDPSLDLANRTCLEYIYRELDRFTKEGQRASVQRESNWTERRKGWMSVPLTD